MNGIGDVVLYTGYIPNEAGYLIEIIKKKLIIGNYYTIRKISPHNWYKLKEDKIGYWYPGSSFSITKDYIKKKYKLKQEIDMKYLYHLLKVPFILLYSYIIYFICFKEFGIIQYTEPYMMDIQHLYTYSILLVFFVYGLYASIRDIIHILKMERIKNKFNVSTNILDHEIETMKIWNEETD